MLIGVSCSSPQAKTEIAEKKKVETKNVNNMKEINSLYDVDLNLLDGSKFNWEEYKGKRIMFVNVASKCGLTPQYEKLEAIYKDLDKSKYAIIGMPANNFLKQEPGSAEDIAEFCTKNYGVSFPLLEKGSVGENIFLSYPPSEENVEKTETSALYQYLTNKSNNGVMDIDVTWNFQKIFVDESGKVYAYLEPREIDANTILETFMQ